MAITPHDSPGTTLVFGGTTFTVTNVTLNYNDVRDRIDISHLGQTTGEQLASQDAPLVGTADDTGVEISFDYIGTHRARRQHQRHTYGRGRPFAESWSNRGQQQRDARGKRRDSRIGNPTRRGQLVAGGSRGNVIARHCV
jgi:hypothetical protein